MAVGGIFGSLLGGYALSNLPINAIYIMFSALPLFQLVTCVFLKESPKGFESTTDNAAHDHADGQNIDSAFAGKAQVNLLNMRALGSERVLVKRAKGDHYPNDLKLMRSTINQLIYTHL